MQISKQTNGKLPELDAYALAQLLIKAGYTVSVRYASKEKGWIITAESDGKEAAAE